MYNHSHSGEPIVQLDYLQLLFLFQRHISVDEISTASVSKSYRIQKGLYDVKMAAHKVNFITGNANKLREVKAILEPEIEVLSKSIDLEEVQGTLEEVTESKCRRAADLVCKTILSILQTLQRK